MENEFTEQPSVMKIASKWGIITAIVLILLGFVWQVLGLVGESWTGFVNLIPVVGFMVMAHNEYKNAGDGFMSYGTGLGLGTLMIVVGGVISSIFTYIYLAFVDDSMIQLIKDKSYEEWQAQGLNDASMEQMEKTMDFMMTPTMMGVAGFLSTLLFGFIVALIVSAITKNSRPDF